MNYDVTIGIPVYNSVEFIRRSMNSALNQTYSSIEFIVVDDGVNDGTMDVVCQFVKKHPRGNDIHIISHPINQGVSVSRNDIIKQAQGKYLYFMDSDDVIAENTITLMMQHVRDKDAEIVFGSYERIEKTGMRTVYQYPFLQLLGEDELACFAYRKYGGIQASACNYLVKTSVLREHCHRFIDSNYWEDLVFTFDLVTFISRAVLLPNITYTYLCRDNSLSHYQRREQITKDEIMQNVRSVDYLKTTSSLLYNKVYFPNRCYLIAMTDLYIACNIRKREKTIVPPISNKEIRELMRHPATWHQICRFKQSRLKNMILYLIGKMPPSVCVMTILCFAKLKKLI